MKNYSIELRRTSFITLAVKARSEKEAEQMAWEQVESFDPSSYADWEIGFINECEESAS